MTKCPGRESNPGPLDQESSVLPLDHRATLSRPTGLVFTPLSETRYTMDETSIRLHNAGGNTMSALSVVYVLCLTYLSMSLISSQL